MERLGGLKKRGRGFGRAGACTTADKRTTASGKGKLKLHASKDPLPLLTKKQSSRESKPKVKFLASAGASASTEKQNNTKPAANSFIRPLTTDAPPKKSTGFSFTKFQNKSGGDRKKVGDFAGKSAPVAFTPSLGKFSVTGLAKKSSNSAPGTAARTDADSSLKPQAKGGLPFAAFRADTKCSSAKKRKVAESTTTCGDKKTLFPSKSNRFGGNGGFALKPLSKDSATNKAPSAGFGGIRPSLSLPANKSSKTKASDGIAMKKRGLLVSSPEVVPAPKRSKLSTQAGAPQQTENAGSLANGTNSSRSDQHSATAIQTSSEVHKSVMPSPSPDCSEECLSGIEEALSMEQLCTLDDDKEDEFLTRATAIEEFTDRVGIEQTQLRNRLLDVHAGVSESLLDALTDLMAEEGGIGIGKLGFDMNIDVDVGDAFLQDEEIQVLQ